VTLAGAVTAMPLMLTILAEVVLAALIYVALARPRRR
jgi:hypothetical protein